MIKFYFQKLSLVAIWKVNFCGQGEQSLGCCSNQPKNSKDRAMGKKRKKDCLLDN